LGKVITRRSAEASAGAATLCRQRLRARKTLPCGLSRAPSWA